MSHFSVLVVTKTPEELAPALQPFHEFECTGTDDQYVKDVDDTAELRAEYGKSTTTRLRDPQGVLHEPWNDRFYREPTEAETREIGPIAGTGGNGSVSWSSRDWNDGRGYRTKVKFVPADYVEVTLPERVLRGFSEWAAEYTGRKVITSKVTSEDTKYGYILVEGNKVTCIDRTNPNCQWDWWKLGGRFSGKLRVKALAAATKGESGLMGSQHSESGYDQCRAGDLDLAAMTRAARERSLGHVEAALGKLAGKGILQPEALRLWKDYVTAKPLAVKAWEDAGRPGRLWDWLAESPRVFEQPFCAMHAARNVIEELGDFIGAGVPDTEPDPIAWANNRPAFTAWAVLKDGQWIEKGEMGWFGMASNEKDDREWETKVSELLASLPADAMLSIVDCHI